MVRKKLLFVCTSNMLRSPTAEAIYKYDNRFEVLSCGTDKDARVRANLFLWDWSDTIVCFEQEHMRFLINTLAGRCAWKPSVFVLDIKDIYDYMQPELITEIKAKMAVCGIV